MDGRIGTRRGDYAIERLLARGGMGAAYAARRADGLPVVLKFLAPEAAAVPLLRERFAREAQALAKLRPHPGVVRVLEALPGDDPCIAMERVEGPTLLRLVQQRGPLPPAEAARLALDVARALEAIHGQGVLHRDVKPANVIVRPSGAACLIDFGAARDAFRTALTLAGHAIGTPGFMAPEQWGAAELDAGADVFGLGATLYQLLVGRPPYEAEDPDELGERVAAGDYVPPRAARPEVPAALEAVVVQMLAPVARFRYATAAECAEDLQRALRGEAPSCPALTSPAGTTPLLLGRRFTVGRAPGCAVTLEHPSVAAHHAQVRREAGGWALYDISGAGARVGTERVDGGRLLRDGDRVQVGAVELRFHDPRQPVGEAWYLRDVKRAPCPAAVVEVLAQQDDPRVATALLERLVHDDEAALQRVARLLGPDVARPAAPLRAAARERARGDALERLRRLAGRPLPDLAACVAWWLDARAHLPPQLGPDDAPRLRVRAAHVRALAELALGERGVALVGRDARCHLRLDAPELPRVVATLHRLHGAVAVTDATNRPAGLLAPGQGLALGPVSLQVSEADDDARPQASSVDDTRVVDAATLDALIELRHPAACRAALLEVQAARDVAPLEAALARLGAAGDDRARDRLRALCARRALAARRLLVERLGEGDPTTWAAHVQGLGGQVLARR